MQAVLDFFTGSGFNLALIYWLCLGVGAILALVSMIFGEILDFAFDSGDFGPFSGPVISTFLAFFGGGGLIMLEVMERGPVASAVGAMIAGGLGSTIVYFGLFRLILAQQGGTTYDPKTYTGTEAQVITGIPVNGTGEITFDAHSGRISGPARSLNKKAIAHSSIVVIERFVGGVYFVRSIDEEPEQEALEELDNNPKIEEILPSDNTEADRKPAEP